MQPHGTIIYRVIIRIHVEANQIKTKDIIAQIVMEAVFN